MAGTGSVDFALEFDDLAGAGSTLRDAGTDLRAATLANVPSGTGVYGDPFLASCVTDVVAALSGRHTSLASECDAAAAGIDQNRSAYQETDSRVADKFERLRALSASSGGGEAG